MSELWLLPIAFCTSTFAGVMGLGGGVMLLAAMSVAVPVQVLLPLHAAVQLASNGSRTLFDWRSIDLSIVPGFVVGAVAGALLGAGLYQVIDLRWLPFAIGVALLVFTWWPLPPVRGAGQLALVGLGFYQTGLGMLVGATGPLGAAVLLRRNQARDWLVTNTALYMSFNHAVRLLAFGMLGFGLGHWWWWAVAMALAAAAGSFLGVRLRRHLPERDYLFCFRLLLTLLSVRLIVSGIGALGDGVAASPHISTGLPV